MNHVAVEIPEKWREVGQGLKLKQGALNSIHASHSHDPNWPQSGFNAVFVKWYNGATSDYTWQHLVEVLQLPMVDAHAVVKCLYSYLEKEYPDW